MKIINYAIGILICIAFYGGIQSAGSKSVPMDEAEKTACRVLRQLSEKSQSWPEVVAYKNAFRFVASHIRDKSDLADDERYFRTLAERNRGILVCMYVDKEPKKDCGFRNMETHSLLETIEEKMKKDHLSTDDILKAINSAKPEDPSKFRTLQKPNN